MAECKHNVRHDAVVRVVYIEDSGRFMAEIRIKCAECHRPFQFIGLPLGLNFGGAAMDPSGQEALLAIAPVGSIPRPLRV